MAMSVRGVIHLLTLFMIFGYIKTQGCSSGIADVVFMVDDSSSVQRSNYKYVLDFVTAVIQSLTIGPDDVQVSFLSFASTVRNQFYLNVYKDVTSITTNVKSIRFRGGGTEITKGLNWAYNHNFAASNGARVGVQQVLIMITDGQTAGTGPEDMAKTIRSDGIKIICLGITDGVNKTQLENIAGDAGLLFYATDFATLGDVQVLISTTTCEATNVPLPDPCDAKPCFNGGTCSSSGANYICDCPASYSGDNCHQDVDECATDLGGCSQLCINLEGGYKCSCNTGFALNQDEKTCSDVNECLDNLHDCEQICVNSVGSFSCACGQSQSLNDDGRTCSATTVPLPDPCDAKPCFNGGTCSSSGTDYSCDCPASYSGANCHQDVDECSNDFGGCSQLCINLDGGYQCSCNTGFILDQDEKTCKDVDECMENLDDCQHTCVNDAGSFSCSCGQGERLNNDGKSCNAHSLHTIRCYECSNLQDVRCGVTFDFPNGSEDAQGYLRTCEGEFVMCRKLEYTDYQQGADTGGVIVTRSCWRSPGVEGYLPADECSDMYSGEACYCSQEACNGSEAKRLSLSTLVIIITYFYIAQFS